MLTESLSDFLTRRRLRLRQFAGPVLHHVENVINTDFALRSHFLNHVASRAELRRQGINDRITGFGNHGERVIHDNAAVVHALEQTGHSAIKFDRATTGTNNGPTDLIENANRVFTFNTCIGERLSRLTVCRIVDRGSLG